MNSKKTNMSCCGGNKSTNKKNKKNSGFLSGIIYGLIPHTGCIAFIIFTILGMTTLTAIFKPLLMSAYFFYMLLGLSFVFATASAIIYLKRNNMLSLSGAVKKKAYLTILYSTTIGINILLFLVIFPIAANMTTASLTGSVASDSLSKAVLKVDIPCPGHAPLISEELKTINGVESIKFRFPDYFDVLYDSYTTTEDELLSLRIFNIYSADLIESEKNFNEPNTVEKAAPVARGCSSCGGCSGACGGSCGG